MKLADRHCSYNQQTPALRNTELIILAQNDLDALSDEQRHRYRLWVFAFLNLYESAWNHHQRGVINDEDMEGWKADYCDQMSRDSFTREASSIESHASRFRQEAAQWCP